MLQYCGGGGDRFGLGVIGRLGLGGGGGGALSLGVIGMLGLGGGGGGGFILGLIGTLGSGGGGGGNQGLSLIGPMGVGGGGGPETTCTSGAIAMQDVSERNICRELMKNIKASKNKYLESMVSLDLIYYKILLHLWLYL